MQRKSRSIAKAPRATDGGAAPRPPRRAPVARPPRRENLAGASFFVDATCIDCDACRWMAGDVFARVGGASAAVAEPADAAGRRAAFQALHACPTHSIHARGAAPGELAAARDDFPLSVPGTRDVYHLGSHDAMTYGAAAYLIVPPSGGGNIMVDVPRFSPWLVARVKALGGARFMLLTHRDDVGAHAAWAATLGAERVIHAAEARASNGTDAAERILEGAGPWPLNGAGEAVVHFAPGHTKGHCALLYTPDAALFSGDTLAWSERLGRLTLWPRYNWWRFDAQRESVAALGRLPWRVVLPGHGRRRVFDSDAERAAAVEAALRAEEGEGFS